MNIAISAEGLVLCVLGLVFTLSSHHMERRSRNYFLAFFSVLILYVLCNLMSYLADEKDAVVVRWSIFFESLLSSLLMLQLSSFILASSGEPKPLRNPFMWVALALWAVYFALLVYTQFSTIIYTIDDAAVYHRGPWYPVLLVPPVLIMGTNAALLWHRRKRLSPYQQRAFAFYLLLPTLAMLLQMRFYGLPLIVLGSCMAGVFMIGYILLDQNEKYYQREQEIARLQTDIMLSQIQPHFLYNSLGAIARLCKDAPEAREAIQKFARYLRGNMDSLTQRDPIPFATELAHTRLYLELEQLRFGGDLQLVYDLESTDFMLPALTLQPLVENAVRYGVRGTENGKGQLRISSRETPDSYEITVADDGPGFDPEEKKEDGRSHVGLSNVRQRLQTMCEGRLEIDTAPGEGCRVTIVLPKED